MLGTNIYIFGGNNGSKATDTILKFDTTTETLETLSVTLPSARQGQMGAAVGTNAYIFGGQNKTEVLRVINL